MIAAVIIIGHSSLLLPLPLMSQKWLEDHHYFYAPILHHFFYYAVSFSLFLDLPFAFSAVSLTASLAFSAAIRTRSFAVSDAFPIAAEVSGAACLASSDMAATV